MLYIPYRHGRGAATAAKLVGPVPIHNLYGLTCQRKEYIWQQAICLPQPNPLYMVRKYFRGFQFYSIAMDFFPLSQVLLPENYPKLVNVWQPGNT
jgi:hypothetical protein